MNRRPLHPVTAEHIDAYRRDGVVCVRNALDQEWIELMSAAIDRVSADPEKYGHLGPSHGKMTSVCYMSRRDKDFADFAALSPVAEIVGTIIGSSSIRMYHDHLFVKPPRSPSIMPWHCDETAWPVVGEMAPNIWTAFSPVNDENGRIEYIGGWHRHCIDRGIHFGFKPGQADGPCPDFEAERDNPSFPFRFLSFDMEPGDCVVFHPFTPHFSRGNQSPSVARTGLALRLFGDDVRWSPASYKATIPGCGETPEGERPSGPLFPILWEREPALA